MAGGAARRVAGTVRTVAGYPGRPSPTCRGRSSSPTTASSRSRSLTLLDLPLERFWTFPFALCGITVVEFRDGRGILRAHNLVEHLAPLCADRRTPPPRRRSALTVAEVTLADPTILVRWHAGRMDPRQWTPAGG